ncbi:AAA-like domain-containing protein [Desulfococcaceae bacterium HSG8]|nr:AAA-like domain-containing protein [Desulfococcaceae bacterium HSG8]
MRDFHSYGPVSSERHFCVERRELREHCKDQIVRDLKEGGYYFTIWGPRQSGKTWLMKQVRKEIEQQFFGRFVIGTISMQGIVMEDNEPDEVFLRKIPKLMLDGFNIDVDIPKSWEEWSLFFHKDKGLFNRPVLMFVDEFDNLPAKIIDKWATVFRDMYLNQESYMLHGLCLVGVRAALGVEGSHGLPFNIQKSLHVPNFTHDEVQELFRQYHEENGQKVEPEVINAVFDVTRGQPGLVCWFAELLTEKYRPDPGEKTDLELWDRVYRRACYAEWNNATLSLIKKARKKYQRQILEIFARSDVPFILDASWCNYLYLNGMIDGEVYVDERGKEADVCRFSCPFVQRRLYNSLTHELVGNFTPVLALEPFDEMEDVFEGEKPDLFSLMTRYTNYLDRLKEKGFTPWREQFREADLRLREAAGHLHLYAWLQSVISKRCTIRPTFPTGSGKVYLHLKCEGKEGVIEIRNFVNASEFRTAKQQAAAYAIQMGLDALTMSLFVPVDDDEVLSEMSGEEIIRDVNITIAAIGWVWKSRRRK